jgi:adenylate cyclase
VRRSAAFRLVTAILIALVVTALAWAGLSAGVFQVTQLRLSDALFPVIRPDPRIVVVGIDDETFRELGTFPLNRRRHAELIRRLDEGGAALIGYDITFSESSGRDPADEALVEAADEAGNVVFGAAATLVSGLGDPLQAQSLDLPFEELAKAAAGVGHVNVIPDPDGVVRSHPPFIEDPVGELVPSLSLTLLGHLEGLDGPVTFRPQGIQIGDRVIRTGEGHLQEINFTEPFRTYSFIDVLRGRVPADAFRDKVVLVGATALGLGDTRLTPLNKSSGEAGVYVHANALNSMLGDASLSAESVMTVVATILLLALLVALAVAFLRVWLASLVAIALGAGYYSVAFIRFDRGRVMNLVYPALAAALTYLAVLGLRYFTEMRERRRVTAVFGRYVAADVVDEVLAAPQNAMATLKGASRPISALFADLRGFTAASDGSAPTDVVAGLNLYLDAMVRAINEESGTIDKFMGDCVMAFWGAPRYVANHAERAIRAGLRMQEYLEEAKLQADELGLRVPGVGVGVATGEAVVGNIGSADRLDYTVIGDTVNTASRICGVAEAGEIVVTEECAAAVDGDAFRIAPLPPLKVKGKRAPLRIFQVLRPGQEPKVFDVTVVIEPEEEKAKYQPARRSEPEPEATPQPAPAKAAGYAPIEPRPGS